MQHNTPHVLQIEHTNLSWKAKTMLTIRNTNPETHCFGVDSHTAGPQQRNLRQSSGTASKVTYFNLRAHPRTDLSHS